MNFLGEILKGLIEARPQIGHLPGSIPKLPNAQKTVKLVLFWPTNYKNRVKMITGMNQATQNSLKRSPGRRFFFLSAQSNHVNISALLKITNNNHNKRTTIIIMKKKTARKLDNYYLSVQIQTTTIIKPRLTV